MKVSQARLKNIIKEMVEAELRSSPTIEQVEDILQRMTGGFERTIIVELIDVAEQLKMSEYDLLDMLKAEIDNDASDFGHYVMVGELRDRTPIVRVLSGGPMNA
jgi:hypothetical protein